MDGAHALLVRLSAAPACYDPAPVTSDDPRSPTFTYEEALATFPRVRELTAEAVQRVESLFQRVQGADELAARRDELDAASQEIVADWAARVRALGCEVKGLWLVDWDNGAGYYCWRYPEAALGHFHGYEEGFAGRVPIQ